MPNIVVEDGEWGSSRSQEIHAVAKSVCDVFHRDALIDVNETVVLRFSETDGPRTLRERGANNEHIILVSARGRLWARLAYQFAHEYCHVFSSHYRVPLVNPFRWLEESICELASLYALRQMSKIWVNNPPYPNWGSYGDALFMYANECSNSVTRFDNTSDFRAWLDANIAVMTACPVIREFNSMVAVQLLPYFERNPDAWHTIVQINYDPNLSGDLDSYFTSWSNGDVGNRHIVAIGRLMGVPL